MIDQEVIDNIRKVIWRALEDNREDFDIEYADCCFLKEKAFLKNEQVLPRDFSAMKPEYEWAFFYYQYGSGYDFIPDIFNKVNEDHPFYHYKNKLHFWANIVLQECARLEKELNNGRL